ncbi:zinc finger protein 768-like [Lethenteron reissneri]|uniref:zinc finger protein 768-like n=1 Tax=Lethenteron reissneri TaxID=7753 RepID=UPI002AB6BB4F|nr:zinc finger protein 768-like [Lethenteron reissneri]
MACAVATGPTPAIASITLDPTRDFPAWLEAQGVNEEVVRAMDSELGIRDYEVLRACVGDGLVRDELLAAARDRLPFGFYAVLRRFVAELDCLDESGAPTRLLQAEAGGGVCGASGNGGGGSSGHRGVNDELKDIFAKMVNGLSRELSLTMQRLHQVDGGAAGDDAGDDAGGDAGAEAGGDVGGGVGRGGDGGRSSGLLGEAGSSQSSPTRDSEHAYRTAVSDMPDTSIIMQDEHSIKLEHVDVQDTLIPMGDEHSMKLEPVDAQQGPSNCLPVSRSGGLGGLAQFSSLEAVDYPDVFTITATASSDHSSLRKRKTKMVVGSANDLNGEATVSDAQGSGTGGVTTARRCAKARPHKCPLCLRNFTSVHLLMEHLLSQHHWQRQKQQGQKRQGLQRHHCTVCGRTFQSLLVATQHMMKHQCGEKLYRCCACGRGYRQMAGLRYHSGRCPGLAKT